MLHEIDDTSAANHCVQLYDLDDEVLIRNVGRYICEGFALGEGALIVANLAHRQAFAAEFESLGFDQAQAVSSGLLVYVDAQETLERILVQGSPDAERFESTIGTVMSAIQALAPSGTLRAYGEMVGILWRSGDVTAAIELEEIWDVQLTGNLSGVFCGYPIDVLGQEFQPALVERILSAHNAVLSSGATRLEAAIDRAVDEIAGPQGLGFPPTHAGSSSRKSLPKADAAALWIRSNLPRHADEILNRARLYYQR